MQRPNAYTCRQRSILCGSTTLPRSHVDLSVVTHVHLCTLDLACEDVIIIKARSTPSYTVFLEHVQITLKLYEYRSD